jgi:hypothetical protein
MSRNWCDVIANLGERRVNHRSGAHAATKGRGLSQHGSVASTQPTCTHSSRGAPDKQGDAYTGEATCRSIAGTTFAAGPPLNDKTTAATAATHTLPGRQPGPGLATGAAQHKAGHR